MSSTVHFLALAFWYNTLYGILSVYAARDSQYAIKESDLVRSVARASLVELDTSFARSFSHERLLASSGGSAASKPFELPPCTGEVEDPVHGCWLHDYVAWHKANRGKHGSKYLIWVCYGPGGPGAHRAATANVYGDNCAGLGDRMRGIEYLARVAAGTRRVLLVYQESPAPMERFLSPGLIDWRLTPDLGLDAATDVVKLAKHYRIPGDGRNRMRDDIRTGTFQNLTARVVTVSTNRPAHVGVGGPVPPMAAGSAMEGLLARALFRLSPEVEEATDAALESVGVLPHQAYVALHLRLGGLAGEEFLLGRLPQDPHELLATAAACAANLTAVFGLQRTESGGLRTQEAGAAGEDGETPRRSDSEAETSSSSAAAAGAAAAAGVLPYLVVTDNDDLRQQVAAGQLPPWVSPDLHPAHFILSHLPGRGLQEQQTEPAEERLSSGRWRQEAQKRGVAAGRGARGSGGRGRAGAAEGVRTKTAGGTDGARQVEATEKRLGEPAEGSEALSSRGAGAAGSAKRRRHLTQSVKAARAAKDAKAALEAVARMQVANMADLGILVRASCVLLSPSGFSVQAHLLGAQSCAIKLQDCIAPE